MVNDAGGYRDDTTLVSAGGEPQASQVHRVESEAEPFPLPTINAEQLSRRAPDVYVRRATLYDACDLINVLLVAAGDALAESWRVRATGFVSEYGRTIQKIQDDSRP